MDELSCWTEVFVEERHNLINGHRVGGQAQHLLVIACWVLQYRPDTFAQAVNVHEVHLFVQHWYACSARQG